MNKEKNNDFINRATVIHNGKYNYSKVEYKNTHTKVCIICPEHGEFWQIPKNHLKKCGCPKCSAIINSKKQTSTTENFIEKAKKIHGDKYDYSKVEYINARTKVCIICPEHGEFWQTPNSHLQGSKCNKCNNIWDKRKEERINTENFIEKCKNIFGDIYNYDKVNIVDSKTKIIITCPKHGDINILPHNFIYRGCPKCNKEKSIIKLKEKNEKNRELKKTYSFIEKIKKQKENLRKKENEIINICNKIHKNKYDYSKVAYKNSKTKICIICPNHGEFYQLASNHMKGEGCKYCSHISTSLKNKSTTEKFIEKAKKIHGDKYDYSKVEYINARTKVCIICPEHGEFWQTPYNHLLMNGCTECGRGKINKEYILKRKLKKYFEKIDIVSEKRFKWLGKQRIDIFFEKCNIGVEYQGMQHFKPVSIFGGENAFKKQRENDMKKYELCKKNKIKLFYFSFDINDDSFPFKVINNIEELIKEIEKVLYNNE